MELEELYCIHVLQMVDLLQEKELHLRTPLEELDLNAEQPVPGPTAHSMAALLAGGESDDDGH